MKTNPAIESGYKDLANAIVICAVRDWAFASRAMTNRDEYKLSDVKKKKDAERFFRSWWCEQLCGITGDIILSRLKREDLTSIIVRTRQMRIDNKE